MSYYCSHILSPLHNVFNTVPDLDLVRRLALANKLKLYGTLGETIWLVVSKSLLYLYYEITIKHGATLKYY